MINRYQDIEIVRNANKKRYYVNNTYPDIPLSENDIYLITAAGDRYDLLAYTYYGDVTLWWVIPTANNLECDSLFPELGIQLRIPYNIVEVLNSYKEINS